MPVVALIDTNIWVSALLNPAGSPARLKDHWIAGAFTVVVSPALLDEVAAVLARPRIRNKYHLNERIISEYVHLIAMRAIMVTPPGPLRVCRDPDDDIILETALVGQATVVVSRDDDLKGDPELIAQMEHRGIQVMSVPQFLTWLASRDAP
jgi:putative PIN family toxin of toxin-antitoxin system